MTNISDWSTFYLMAGTAIASLTGLLFVGASLHLREVLARPDITRQMATALAGLVADLLFCGAMLVPLLTVQAVGIVLMVIGVAFAALFGRPDRRGYWPLVVLLVDVVLGVLLLAGWNEGLYVVAALIGIQAIGLVSLSWRLLTLAVAR